MCARGLNKVSGSTEVGADEVPAKVGEVSKCFRKKVHIKYEPPREEKEREWGQGAVQTEGKPRTKAPQQCMPCLGNSK